MLLVLNTDSITKHTLNRKHSLGREAASGEGLMLLCELEER